MIATVMTAALGLACHAVMLVKEHRAAARIEQRLQNIARRQSEQTQRDAERVGTWLGRPKAHGWVGSDPSGLSRPASVQ